LLKLFLEHPGRVFTKAQLYERVWEEPYIGDDLVRQLARVNDILAKISGGNYNLRFRVQTANLQMKRLSANLNGLVDQFQQTLKRIHYLEHARKKMLA